jgi:hypothetical protein
MATLMRGVVFMLLLASSSAITDAEKITNCNQAMLNDFDSMSQDEMMECAALLEEPLLQLEEENKVREAEEKLAREKAKAEADKKAALEAQAQKKRQAEAAAVQKAKNAERERQASMVKGLQQDLASCSAQYQNALVAADSLSQCQTDLGEFKANSVRVDPRIKPLFGNRNLETVVLPIITVFAILFWMLGCCMGTTRVTPIVNPVVGNAGVAITDVSIQPGHEIVVVKNKTFNDMDLTGCSLRVADHVYHFDDAYNLAKGTFLEVHAGPEAKEIKKLIVSDNDKFDSRRCNKLFWTSASVFLGSGETSASLLDSNDHVLCSSN